MYEKRYTCRLYDSISKEILRVLLGTATESDVSAAARMRLSGINAVIDEERKRPTLYSQLAAQR